MVEGIFDTSRRLAILSCDALAAVTLACDLGSKKSMTSSSKLLIGLSAASKKACSNGISFFPGGLVPTKIE
ncbi:hypothetical protein D3C85_1811590 [compost metagenome]